ncbi:hypothetical protein CBS101457_003800 [Exobasidium rhododendri]|nr:hypothetical protein CBS101457_003800 [Exobasidium rhododendri]
MPSMPTSATLPVITSPQLAFYHTRFPHWFSLYRRFSPKATVIDLLTLQPDFVEWLEEDGLILPRDSDDDNEDQKSDHDDDEEEEEEEEEEGGTLKPRDFAPLNERIRQIISTYEGAVFPKLDWSAPSDAAWIVPGSTLRCTTPSDIYLLLKSSDFVSKDITQLRELEVMKLSDDDGRAAENIPPHSTSIRPVLVLKKFFTIPTSHEFRCFVRAGSLICISQRDTGTYFDHLQDHSFRLKVRKLLRIFFLDNLSPQLRGGGTSSEAPSDRRRTPFPINDFVWDAYISRDMSKVFLMDVNPYLERTDALLWTWSEIEKIAERWSGEENCSDDGLDDEDEDDEDEDESDDEEEETIMRIFTDGREPILIRPSGQAPRTAKPPKVPLPRLRTITSRAQTTQSFPTYGRNMIPSDVVGAAEGNNIAIFAKEWNHQIARAAVNEVDGDDEDVLHLPTR